MRTQNTTAIKVKFLGATNTAPARLKITQLNNNKSKTISLDYNFDVIGQIENILNNIILVESFNLIIDNTQNNFYTFVINTSGNSFPNIIEFVK